MSISKLAHVPFLAPLGLALTTLVAACDDGATSARSDVAAPDIGSEVAPDVAAADSAPAPDTAVAPDVAPDTVEPADMVEPADTAEPVDTVEPADTVADAEPDGASDVPELEVCAAVCGEVEPGQVGIDFLLHDATEAAPTLAAGDGTDGLTGRFEATAMEIYVQGAVGDGIALTLADDGTTSMAAEVANGSWVVSLELGLAFESTVGEVTSGGTLARSLVAATCQTGPSAGALIGAIACGEGWPVGVDLPDPIPMRYDADSDSVSVLLTLSKELLVAFVDADFQALADLVLSGPVVLQVRLERLPVVR